MFCMSYELAKIEYPFFEKHKCQDIESKLTPFDGDADGPFEGEREGLNDGERVGFSR